MRRLPVPLLAILCIAALQALAWSILLPPFQGQDEAPHFAYTQRLAETGEPTWSALEDDLPLDRAYSNEVFLALEAGGFGPLARNVSMRQYGTEIDEARYRAAAGRLTDADRGNGAFTSSMRNPPLYYLYGAAAYLPLEGQDVVTRLYAMRWATIPFFLVAVLTAWLLAGEVFGRRRWLQAIAALFVALQPMLAQLAGVVNPDAAIAAIWGVGLWLAAVIVNRGVSRGLLVAAAATTIVAALAHPRAAPVAAALVAGLAARGWRATRDRPGRRRLVLAASACGTLALLAAGVLYAMRDTVGLNGARQFASYLWQFYLPRPSFMTPTLEAGWDKRDVFVDRLWSGFAQLEVNLSAGVLDAISLATMAAAVVVIVTLVARRDAVRRHIGLAIVFAVAPLVLMFSLHVAAWRDLQVQPDPIITGRYLTPLLPLAGIAVAAVAASIPRRAGVAIASVVLGLEGVVALSALGTAMVRFYA